MGWANAARPASEAGDGSAHYGSLLVARGVSPAQPAGLAEHPLTENIGTRYHGIYYCTGLRRFGTSGLSWSYALIAAVSVWGFHLEGVIPRHKNRQFQPPMGVQVCQSVGGRNSAGV